MDTTEHTELGDSLRFNDWNTLKDNPYIHLKFRCNFLLAKQT